MQEASFSFVDEDQGFASSVAKCEDVVGNSYPVTEMGV